ncbi:MAG: phage late control D family protein, partial [Desulfovibrionaceae bacterium]|nr:phage late control D family protein [Desulfovibrionaceae bacterium]
MSVSWQFSSSATSASLCRVLAFNAEDRILHGYAFDILVKTEDVPAENAAKLMDDLLRAPLIALTGKTSSGAEFSWQGMPASVSYLFSDGDSSIFRVLLRPRSYRACLNTHSRIFLHMPLPQILSKTLKEEGFTAANDFEIALKGSYPRRPYTCQYNESSADFLLRHLERAGGYSYVRQTDDGDVLVLADGQTQPEKLPVRDNLDWSEDHADETVFCLSRTRTAAPTKVTLRDYSTEQPGSTAKSASDTRQLCGGGEINLYASCNFYGEVDSSNQDFVVEEANAAAENLAKIEVRRLISQSNRAEGESSAPWLRAGYAVSIGG